ncbi:MAG: hypothetical protein OEO20_11230 [Gemmatimonadota bacterium]|nr:hypothetical protein [Gemmatimonadota bacterium]MDH3368929.1 hypothetical protein [Gemmatimonadota bacterium]MDH3478865.1 hypothetical protein [Gemmatimonadota bacterium]MDH3571411.1 hypothetical protein [Gemmatimonadota bacterium]
MKNEKREAKYNPMSHGGLNPTKTAGAAKRSGGSMLESSVSGVKLPGKAPVGGMGGKSPSADAPAAQAARAGHIASSGQARGGPRSQSSKTNTPSGGTGGGKRGRK